MTPTPIEELTKFKRNRERLNEVLQIIAEMGGTVEQIENDKGSREGYKSATTVIKERMREPLVRKMSAGAFGDYINKLFLGDWIEMDRRGKRTPWIRLKHPEAVAELIGQPTASPNGDTETTGPSVVAGPAEPTHEPPMLAHGGDGEELAGVRPGRLLARVENTLPGIVMDAVQTALKAERDIVYNAQGYWYGINPDQYHAYEQDNERLHSEVAKLQSTIESISAENRRLQSMVDYMGDLEDERLRRSNDGQIASKKSMTVNQVPEQYRTVARAALEQQWNIRPCRGAGHIAWINPDGKMTFSASTPGSNSRHLLIRKVRRMGLVFGGRSQETADETQSGHVL